MVVITTFYTFVMTIWAVNVCQKKNGSKSLVTAYTVCSYHSDVNIAQLLEIASSVILISV